MAWGLEPPWRGGGLVLLTLLLRRDRVVRVGPTAPGPALDGGRERERDREVWAGGAAAVVAVLMGDGVWRVKWAGKEEGGGLEGEGSGWGS